MRARNNHSIHEADDKTYWKSNLTTMRMFSDDDAYVFWRRCVLETIIQFMKLTTKRTGINLTTMRMFSDGDAC